MGTSPWVISTLNQGYRLPFSAAPPHLTRNPDPYEIDRQGKPDHTLVSHISNMLVNRAIEVVRNKTTPGLYCHVFTRPKKTGGSRPIINLRPLNACLLVPKFRMQTTASLVADMQQGEWAASIDLKDAYFHVPVHQSARKYLRFFFQGVVYQFRALPFGLATAPRVFTMVIRQLAKYLHQRGVKFHYYLDDWLIRGKSKQEVANALRIVIHCCKALGLVINDEKSELVPAQQFTFLGIVFDTKAGLCFVPLDRQAEILARAERMLETRMTCAAKVLRLLGRLVAAEKQVPFGRIHMRALQLDLHRSWRHPDNQLRTKVFLSSQSRKDLLWWTDPWNMGQGTPFGVFKPERHLFTDASLQGWGAHLLSGETWGEQWTTPMKRQSINVLELQAIYLGLQHFQHNLRDQSVQIASDNTVAVYYLNKQGGTRNERLLSIARHILDWAALWGVTLRARHIPGKLNAIADGLSRRNQLLTTEWSLCPRVLERIWQKWHRPLVDLFATRFNHKLPAYVSPCPDPQAWGVDALSISWDGLDAYAYPPTSMLQQTLQKMERHRCRMIIIAPYWPSMQWFPQLLDLLTDHPVRLPANRDLLKQSHNSMVHSRPDQLQLHAWRLSTKPSDIKDFQNKCAEGLLAHPENLPR